MSSLPVRYAFVPNDPVERMLYEQILKNAVQQAVITVQQNTIVQLTTYLANQQIALRNTGRDIQYTYRNLNYLGLGVGLLASIFVGGNVLHAYFRSTNNGTFTG